MEIKVTNTRSYISKWPANKNAIIKAFQKKSKNAFWQRRYNKFAGPTSFVSPKQGVFPTGLLEDIKQWAIDNNEALVIDDQRIVPPLKRKTPLKEMGLSTESGEPYVLRDYQLQAVKACLDNHRGLIKAATGSGKTLMAADVIRCIDHPALFVVERINLATQTKKKFCKEYGYSNKEVGIVGGKHNDQGKLVTITTIQSAHKLNNTDRFKVLILDESHHGKAKTYIALFKTLKECYYRFGFSGTVFGEDELDDTYRISQFGPVLADIGTSKLIDEKVLSKPTIRFIDIECEDVSHHRQYLDQYKEGICRNFNRNRVIIKFANGLSGRTLILFRLIEHGDILKKYIPKALYMDGDTPSDIRDKILKAFEKTPEGVLLASTIADEGIDFANIHNLIIAGGEKSIIKQIQRLGRGLRKNDMMAVNVIEFMDRGSNILERQSKKRLKQYVQEGHDCKILTMKGEQI
jgi:superfamily II DNA or RNA helicase